jgi:hypothetical protein
VALQRAGEVVTAELATLVRIKNLGPAVARERFLERLDTNSAASVFDSRYARTARLTRSMITTK